MRAFLQPRRYSSKALATWGGLLLAAAAALTILAAVDGGTPVFQPIDDWWYEFIRDQRAEFLLHFNVVLDWLGYTGIFIYHGLIFALLLRRQRWAALFTIISALSMVAVTQALKYLIGRERPDHQLVHTQTPSFPSGHTTTTVAAVMATGYIVGRWWVWFAGFCLAIIMMLSRTYLGVHWLSDTITGYLIATGTVTFLWIYFQDKCVPWNRYDRPSSPAEQH